MLLFLALFSTVFSGWGFPVRAMESGQRFAFLESHTGNRYERSRDVIDAWLLVDLLSVAIVMPNQVLHILGNHAPMLQTHVQFRSYRSVATDRMTIMFGHSSNDASARARNQAQPVPVPEKSANLKGSF